MPYPLSYVAGLFDGEGSVGVYGSRALVRRTHMLIVQTTQVDSAATRSLLADLSAQFGGRVSWQATSSGRGKLNWQLRSDAAASLLEALLPHLVLKRHQALLGSAWQRGRAKPERGPRGRLLALPTDERALNEAVTVLMAMLKRIDYETIVSDPINRCLIATVLESAGVDQAMTAVSHSDLVSAVSE